MVAPGYRLCLSTGMKLTATNPFLDQRDFRALIFQDACLDRLENAVALFDGIFPKGGAQYFECKTEVGNVRGCRVIYHSKQCFLRSTDPAKRELLQASGSRSVFQYEVYALAYTRAAQQVFMVAIPFSSMARELFGKIHERKPSSRFTYLRPDIDALVSKLQQPFKGAEQMKTVGMSWTVTGDTGRSDQVIVRGSDVLHSSMFRYLQEIEGVSLNIRKMQIRYEVPDRPEVLKMSFDKFGNYGVWVRSEGSNLPMVFEVFEMLNRSKMMIRDEAFPVRSRDDDPIMP